MPFIDDRLRPPGSAPDAGEDTFRLATLGGVKIEQILSGRLHGPVDYQEDVDEWVVLLQGGAILDVGGQLLQLGPGDWVLLPAGTAHRLVETQPGTSWLTVTTT